MNFEAIAEWPTVFELQADGLLLVEDGNHGEYRPRPDEFVDSGPALFIRAADMSDGRILFDKAKAIDDVALNRIRKGIGRAGDVIFSHKGTVGKVALAPADSPPFVCSPQTTFWRTLDGSTLDRRFLHAFLRSPAFVYQWHGRKGETDMADYVSLTAQRRLRVPMMPVAEQRLIGAAIAQFDDLIENNRRRIEILEEMARLLYREWFVHFRYPGHEDIELVDSELGLIPEGWEVATFADVAEFVNGFAFKSSEHWQDEGLPIVKIKELKAGVTAETPRYHGKDIKARYFVDDRDVLFSWSADLDAYVWSGGPALVNQHLFVVRPYELPSLFIFHSLQGRMDQFRARAQGTTMKHIKRSALSEVSTVVPNARLIATFDDAVGPMLDLQVNLTRQNRVLRETRDLLLPRLVSGELDVSDLDLGVC